MAEGHEKKLQKGERGWVKMGVYKLNRIRFRRMFIRGEQREQW